MRTRSLILAALAFGVVVAVVVALAVPTRSRGDEAPQSAANSKRIVVLPYVKPKLERGSAALVLAPGVKPRVERTIKDPDGGLPWAVRTFRATRLAPVGEHPTVASSHVLGHELCAQLGRVYKGRFGWLDATRRFRPAAPEYNYTPLICGDRWRDLTSRPEVRLTTLISDPTQPEARVTAAVFWGLAGSDANAVALKGVRTGRAALGASGTFLVVANPRTAAEELEAEFSYRSHGTMRAIVRRDPTQGRTHKPEAIPGTARLEARSPDPGGGVPWGMVTYKTKDGSYCITDPGRIVGDRVGGIDFRLDTFDDARASARHCLYSTELRLPPGMPVSIGATMGGAMPLDLDPTQDPDTGRTAVRTLPGRTVVYGIAREGVRELTVESPRDVRTLKPSARARAFLIVYDGMFPSGKINFSAALAGGRTLDWEFPIGMGG